jgi:hypothetical protein
MADGEASGLEFGPERLRTWSEEIAGVVNANHNECVTRHAFGSGTSTDPSGGDGGDGGGAGGDTSQYYVVIDGVLYTQFFVTDGAPIEV